MTDHQIDWVRLVMPFRHRGSSGSKRRERGSPGSSFAEWSWRRIRCRRLPVQPGRRRPPRAHPGRRPPRAHPGRRPPRAHLTRVPVGAVDPRLQRQPRAPRPRLRLHRPQPHRRLACFSDRPSPRTTGPALRLGSRRRAGTSAGPSVRCSSRVPGVRCARGQDVNPRFDPDVSETASSGQAVTAQSTLGQQILVVNVARDDHPQSG